MSESTRIPPRRKSKGDGQFMFSALILVLVIASLLGMYFYMEDQKSQSEASVKVIAGKVQNIEDKLSITNEDSAQNMDTVTDQISFLDKEVRKLWAHRKGYLDNFSNQENQIDSNERSIKNLKSQVTGVDDKLGSLSEKIQLAEDLQLKITLLTNELNKQKKVIEENEQALGAIDQYRIQNNQKIIKLGVDKRQDNYQDHLESNLIDNPSEDLISFFQYTNQNRSGWRSDIVLKRRIKKIDESINDLDYVLGRMKLSYKKADSPAQFEMNFSTEKTQNENYSIVYDSVGVGLGYYRYCLLYTSPSPRDRQKYRKPSSA